MLVLCNGGTVVLVLVCVQYAYSSTTLLQEGMKQEEVERQLCQEESCIEWTKQRMRERNVMVVGVKER